MKKIKYLFGIIMFATAVLAFQSCSDKDVNAPVASFINIYENGTPLDSYKINATGSDKMIGVRSDGDWTATTDADWLTISNHQGYGYGADSTFYVKVTASRNDEAVRTAHVVFTSGNVTKSLEVSQKSFQKDAGDTWMGSYEFVDNMVCGYNLGNTLESDPDQAASSWWKPKSDLDWETVWGQPKTTQAIIDTIAAKGFNVIRVPVTWWPHVDENGKIKEIWMNRVKEVVGYVLAANCYCIINVMHDTGARNGRSDDAGWLSANPDEYEASSVRFKDLWNQIATSFKDYDEHLLFESFNEILDGNDTWGDPSNTGCYATINKLQQDFVNTVRATGGNNEYRNLIVTTYSAGATVAKLNGFEAPEDIHPQHLIASIHSYDPYNFCNDNGEYNIYMFDDACQEEILNIFENVNSCFNDRCGIPYIFGEFGAIDDGKDMGERVKYAQYMTQMFDRFNTKGSWWMGLYDRRKKKWYENEIANALFAK